MERVTEAKTSIATTQRNGKGPQSTDCEIVIVGAGPYGLSAASYLQNKKLSVRVFGEPMEFWAKKMPEGMLLRSPREASTIADPRSRWTLEAYEAAVGREPLSPLPLSAFVNYGRWFREQLGADVMDASVTNISRADSGFVTTLKGGEQVKSKMAVVAAGIASFCRKPQVFSDLPAAAVSHCYEGRTIASLTRKRVAVIGAGQSALESAALLSEAGADVEIICKIPELRWIGMHKWLHRMGPISKMMYSKYDVGPLGLSKLVSYPKLMSFVPLTLKDKIRNRAVRPAGSHWLPARLHSVKLSTGRAVQKATMIQDEVQLRLVDGTTRRVDHVLMCTGYDVDIWRYQFLDRNLLSQVRLSAGYPDLTSGCACSVPGLHFIGGTAARKFGPLLYFIAGTEFASRELSSHLSR